MGNDSPRRLRRKEASAYLQSAWGLRVAPQTLAKLACEGGGPIFQKFGRSPMYEPVELDVWATARLGPKIRSNTEHKALCHAPA